MPLSDVMVSYDCVDDSLLFGVSKMVSGQAVVTGKLPICLGGFISGLKQDYFPKTVKLNTVINESADVILEMEPVTTLKLKARIRPIVKEVGGTILNPTYYWTFKDNASVYFDNDETLVLIFKRQSLGEDNFVKEKVINNTNLNNQTIDLVSGMYKIQGLLFMKLGENYTRNNITVPNKTIEYDTNGWLPGGHESVTIDEMVFNESFYEGGLLWDNTTSGYFNITKEDLTKNEMTVYISAFSDVDQITDIQIDLPMLGGLMDFSITHKEAMTPKFE